MGSVLEPRAQGPDQTHCAGRRRFPDSSDVLELQDLPWDRACTWSLLVPRRQFLSLAGPPESHPALLVRAWLRGASWDGVLTYHTLGGLEEQKCITPSPVRRLKVGRALPRRCSPEIPGGPGLSSSWPLSVWRWAPTLAFLGYSCIAPTSASVFIYDPLPCVSPFISTQSYRTHSNDLIGT